MRRQPFAAGATTPAPGPAGTRKDGKVPTRTAQTPVRLLSRAWTHLQGEEGDPGASSPLLSGGHPFQRRRRVRTAKIQVPSRP